MLHHLHQTESNIEEDANILTTETKCASTSLLPTLLQHITVSSTTGTNCKRYLQIKCLYSVNDTSQMTDLEN